MTATALPPHETERCDVAVIGAGTAGIAAERNARAAGARTRLIDPEFAGTTCATVGCMPSKLLIAAAAAAAGAAEAPRFGVSTTVDVDGRAVMARLRRHRDRFAAGVRESLEELPEGTRLKGRARFIGPTTLALDSGARVEARAVVIATGARPAIPEAFAALGERILTNERIFALDDLPASLGVIGGGPEGVELAQALARLGVEVTLFEAGGTLATLPQPVSEALRAQLAEDFALHLDTSPDAAPEADGVRLGWPGGTCRVERLLIAAGRPPALDALDLAAAGLELDDHGTPCFDRQTLQCGDAPVFIAGDANHDRPVLHEASAEGTIAGRNAAAWPDSRPGARAVPLAIAFTRPEAATVGRQPGDDAADEIVTGTADYGDQGRAVVEGRAGGAVHLHAERRSGRLIGAALCAPDGGHLAHLLAWAVSHRLTADQMLHLPFYHPTLEEGMRPALRELCAACETPRPWDRNDQAVPGD